MNFFTDLQIVYKLSGEYLKQPKKYYELLKKGKNAKLKFIDESLEKLNLEITPENRYAFINRLASLREDALLNVLYKYSSDKKEIENSLNLAYDIVSNYYIESQDRFVDEIYDKEILTPFYKEVLRGSANVGKALTKLHVKWSYQLKSINEELLKECGSDDKVIEFLNSNNLLDVDDKNQPLERCYTLLFKNSDGGYEALTYAKAFVEEIKDVCKEIDTFYSKLYELDDILYDQKEFYLSYLNTLKFAFKEEDSYECFKKWQDVDRAWMNIKKAPLQIGHPLEYYEDRYRKAVAIEWDLRLKDIDYGDDNSRAEIVKSTFQKLFSDIDKDGVYSNVLEKDIDHIDRTQLFIGRPVLFYGSSFNGLFSAQVVPNDESVSNSCGKKIFAFPINTLEQLQSKPLMKITTKIVPKEFVNFQRNILLKKENIWYKVYDITTIGHEYGHILWLDDDSEKVMNRSGCFKNIEELKATLGGLVSFFYNEKSKLKLPFLADTIERAIKLISWMRSEEVMPYYCEGLMHLKILFDSNVLIFENDKLTINLFMDSYYKAKEQYISVYKELAKHYLEKRDAKEFLDRYVHIEDGFYKPNDEVVKSFVDYYWSVYQDIGELIEDQIEG